MAKPRSFKETYKHKAHRLKREGKVEVIEEHERYMVTRVEGDHATYEQTHFDDETAFCTCPSMEMYCSHVRAAWERVGRKFRPEDTLKEKALRVCGDDNIV